MAKNFLERLSKIAIFRIKEPNPKEAQDQSGVSLALDSGSALGLERKVEDDRDQVRGVELGTRLYPAGQTAGGTLNQKRAKPDFLGIVLGFFFGQALSQEVGDGIYQHTITPLNSLYLPSFTLLQRRGDSIFKERFIGNFIESFSLELGESWVSLSAGVKGTGKRETNYFHELVKAPANTLEITLAENGIEGESLAERLENVFRVRAKDVGSSIWKVCSVVGVSQTVPAVITIAEPVGQSLELVDFHIDYIPVEPSWCEFPEEWDESPLRLVDAEVIVDGYFNGEQVLGGKSLSSELLEFSIQARNQLEPRKLADGSGELWASEAIRGSREITIKISERLKNTIRQWQAEHPETERLSIYLKIRGAEIEPGSGYYFGADLIFPNCGILNLPVVVNGEFFAQQGDLLVMDDGVYGGVFIRLWNRVSEYLG